MPNLYLVDKITLTLQKMFPLLLKLDLFPSVT